MYLYLFHGIQKSFGKIKIIHFIFRKLIFLILFGKDFFNILLNFNFLNY